MKLKEHFSTAATTTIESVFWIAKSKSAFVNYRTGEALLDAMKRFHDSKFEGVRLVCRVRKTGVPVLIDPTATAGNDNRNRLSLAVDDFAETAKYQGSSSGSPGASQVNMKAPLENNAKKRFFVLKSLATEDLESSVQSGHWVTQKHNETALNQAFAVWTHLTITNVEASDMIQCTDDVYLIFSANKSGEYFGYAKMKGLIEEHSPPSLPARGREDAMEKGESDMPEIVFTPGTECAPEGAIFIDAYRGTIFWEADIASQDDSSPKLFFGAHEVKTGTEGADTAKDKEWNLSSPFEVEWISTSRVPFLSHKRPKKPMERESRCESCQGWYRVGDQPRNPNVGAVSSNPTTHVSGFRWLHTCGLSAASAHLATYCGILMLQSAESPSETRHPRSTSAVRYML